MQPPRDLCSTHPVCLPPGLVSVGKHSSDLSCQRLAARPSLPLQIVAEAKLERRSFFLGIRQRACRLDGHWEDLGEGTWS